MAVVSAVNVALEDCLVMMKEDIINTDSGDELDEPPASTLQREKTQYDVESSVSSLVEETTEVIVNDVSSNQSVDVELDMNDNVKKSSLLENDTNQSMDLIETNQSMDIDSGLIRRRLRGGGRRLLEEKARVSLYSMLILLVYLISIDLTQYLHASFHR